MKILSLHYFHERESVPSVKLPFHHYIHDSDPIDGRFKLTKFDGQDAKVHYNPSLRDGEHCYGYWRTLNGSSGAGEGPHQSPSSPAYLAIS
ncbi:hypothetical protein CRG98_038406 [Punica granatum]|uniref:Uncharacterized protein n=1 Tax=Punica granatum TaxID=22663 RepID=A0A2I0IBZ3_PUNGR|nr:hypothetical protein CRG98_038406 [Punica granatum]